MNQISGQSGQNREQIPQHPRRAYTVSQPLTVTNELSMKTYYQHITMLEIQRSLDVLMYEMRINTGLDRSSSGISKGATAGPATPDTITHAVGTTNYHLSENGA
ncbi:hypothetical protein NW762_013551 [Fusarium torreyae]|uniref:Uncharacterized protein n=1 Tax=Fusarium torreyae TaxID=1237075 RepID=A0A9W8RKL0_9HYPO|nr:hypothetical protein NW762_013551 [Fusarium torreyae]